MGMTPKKVHERASIIGLVVMLGGAALVDVLAAWLGSVFHSAGWVFPICCLISCIASWVAGDAVEHEYIRQHLDVDKPEHEVEG